MTKRIVLALLLSFTGAIIAATFINSPSAIFFIGGVSGTLVSRVLWDKDIK